MCQSACAKYQRSIPNRHHHLPEVETHRSVSLPIAIGPAVRTLFAKKTKNKDCANRNRHVPSATDRLSTGTVIFPMSKHIDYCLSQSDRTSRSDGIREKAKNKVCQLSCARCHQSILNGHRHLPEVETHRSVPLPVAIGPAVRTLFAKGLKISILPIAIGMCQVPPIACQQAQSYSRCRSTSIIVSPVPNPIGPVVQTVFAKRLKYKVCQSSCAKCHQSILNGHRHIPEVESHRLVPLPFRSNQPFGTLFAKGLKVRIVPIAISMCQVPPIDSQEAPSSSRGGNTSISASPHSDRTDRSDVIRVKTKN